MSANELKPNRILEPGQSYTFRSYFVMPQEPDEILAGFGVRLQRTNFVWSESLKHQPETQSAVAQLKQDIQRRLPYVSLTSEVARCEVLIAPVVLMLVDYTQAQLRIEYGLNVSEQLQGTLDYYLHGGQAQNHLLVVEAKQADLAQGFTQLAVEVIALDRWSDSNHPVFYGAVSTGDVWQLGRLHRREQIVESRAGFDLVSGSNGFGGIVWGVDGDRPPPPFLQ